MSDTADVLSVCNSVGGILTSAIGSLNLNSIKSHRECMISFPKVNIAVYSSSAELSAIIVCLLEVQETGVPLRVMRIPVVDLLVSLNPAQSASAYAVSGAQLRLCMG